MDVVYTWANGSSFSQICKMTDVFEGNGFQQKQLDLFDSFHNTSSLISHFPMYLIQFKPVIFLKALFIPSSQKWLIFVPHVSQKWTNAISLENTRSQRCCSWSWVLKYSMRHVGKWKRLISLQHVFSLKPLLWELASSTAWREPRNTVLMCYCQANPRSVPAPAPEWGFGCVVVH